MDIQCAAEIVEITRCKKSIPRLGFWCEGEEPTYIVHNNRIIIREPESDPVVSLDLIPSLHALEDLYEASPAEIIETEILQNSFREKTRRKLKIDISGPVNLKVREVDLKVSTALNNVTIECQNTHKIQLLDFAQLRFDVAQNTKIFVSGATDSAVYGTLRDSAQGYFRGDFLKGFDVDDSAKHARKFVDGRFLQSTRDVFYTPEIHPAS